MSRSLILTPYEHGVLAALNEVINNTMLPKNGDKIDIPHLLLSVLTMAGVDSIESIGSIQNSDTKLVKNILTQKSVSKWAEIYKKTQKSFELFKRDEASAEINRALEDIKHKVNQLLFSLNTNSGILSFIEFQKDNYEQLLPLEVVLPLRILNESIQSKKINLPIAVYEVEKIDVKRFVSVLESKEFYFYKEAQAEIEQSNTLSDKTIGLIENAGKELYRKNRNLFNMEDKVVKMVPLTSKVVELFFGKLPGILIEFSGNLLSDYLKINKSIPIYNCGFLLEELTSNRLRNIDDSMNNK